MGVGATYPHFSEISEEGAMNSLRDINILIFGLEIPGRRFTRAWKWEESSALREQCGSECLVGSAERLAWKGRGDRLRAPLLCLA